MPAVLELAAGGGAGHGRQRRVHPALGLHPRLLVDRPNDHVFRGIQVQTAHVAGLLPEVGIVARHPGLDLPRLEVERPADAPHLRRRDGHPMGVHHLGESVHGPTRRPVRRRLGHRLDHQQHVVVVIYARPSRPFLIAQPGEAELGIARPPQPDLVVMHPDNLTDRPVRLAIGCEQHNARPFRRARLHGRRPHPTLQDCSVATAQLQRR